MLNTLKLYYINTCPGARAVRLYLKLLGSKINLSEKLIDLSKGDHMTNEFLKLNPMHTVPTVEFSDGTSLWESRVILKYLFNTYGNVDKNDSIHFEIDKWLYWDLGFLNTNVGKVIYPRLFMDSEPSQTDIHRLIEKMDYLETTLTDRDYLVKGVGLTIADLSSAMLVHNSQVRNDIVNINKYPNVDDWLNRIKAQFSETDWNDVMKDFVEWRTNQQL